jgi:hypothetical protein
MRQRNTALPAHTRTHPHSARAPSQSGERVGAAAAVSQTLTNQHYLLYLQYYSTETKALVGGRSPRGHPCTHCPEAPPRRSRLWLLRSSRACGRITGVSAIHHPSIIHRGRVSHPSSLVLDRRVASQEEGMKHEKAREVRVDPHAWRTRAQRAGTDYGARGVGCW